MRDDETRTKIEAPKNAGLHSADIASPSPASCELFPSPYLGMQRRQRAAEILLREGYTQVYIAEKLQVTQATISRWFHLMPPAERAKRVRRKLPDATRLLPPTTRLAKAAAPRYLTPDALRAVWERELPRYWSGTKFGEAIFRAYGIRYSGSYCCGLLKQLKAAAEKQDPRAGAPAEGIKEVRA